MIPRDSYRPIAPRILGAKFRPESRRPGDQKLRHTWLFRGIREKHGIWLRDLFGFCSPPNRVKGRSLSTFDCILLPMNGKSLAFFQLTVQSPCPTILLVTLPLLSITTERSSWPWVRKIRVCPAREDRGREASSFARPSRSPLASVRNRLAVKSCCSNTLS